MAVALSPYKDLDIINTIGVALAVGTGFRDRISDYVLKRYEKAALPSLQRATIIIDALLSKSDKMSHEQAKEELRSIEPYLKVLLHIREQLEAIEKPTVGGDIYKATMLYIEAVDAYHTCLLDIADDGSMWASLSASNHPQEDEWPEYNP